MEQRKYPRWISDPPAETTAETPAAGNGLGNVFRSLGLWLSAFMAVFTDPSLAEIKFAALTGKPLPREEPSYGEFHNGGEPDRRPDPDADKIRMERVSSASRDAFNAAADPAQPEPETKPELVPSRGIDLSPP